MLVAVSGLGSPADRERTAAAGFHLHLVKPVDPAILVGVVTRFARSAPEADHGRGQAV